MIDKNRAAGLLAEQLSADVFLMLTDVDAVYKGWGTERQRRIDRVRPPGSTLLISRPVRWDRRSRWRLRSRHLPGAFRYWQT